MDEFRKGWFFAPDDGGANGGGEGEDDQEQNGNNDGEKLEWDAWLKDQSEPVQELITERESGLKTALSSERDARKKAEKDLRDVAKQLEEGSDAQKEVLRLADDVAARDQKTDFYEDAHEAGVTNLKLAYLVAKEEDLFDRKGLVDFKEMKKDFPELFGRKKAPRGNAGDGTGSDLPAGKNGMNELIRRAAGKSG